MKNIVGREKECAELQRLVDSSRSELVIVYGRRRIGKTFLVEEFFNQKFDFRYVGGHGMNTRQQLRNFAKVLATFTRKPTEPLNNWFEAFDALENYLQTLPNKKKIVFIDEMPWMDSGRSSFVVALENFWNGWAMAQRNIMLIATGSATSWMRDKLVANKGGLHGRITSSIHLSPFTLHETELYLEKLGITWDRYQIAQAYMLLGGVPFYYSLLRPELSLAQNVDELFFGKDGCLKLEFDELYSALFNNAKQYLEVVKLLSNNKSGMTVSQLSQALNYKGGNISTIIKNLERSDIVEKWNQYGNKKRGAIFRLTDFYTLFYYKFVEPNLSKDPNWWSNNLESRAITAWMGNSFELVCMKHLQQVKQALKINAISTQSYTWSIPSNNKDNTPGAQIDMIIERADRIIHLCEIKFSTEPYIINSKYEAQLRERAALFRLTTNTKKTLVHTFVTTYGVANGKHRSIVHSEVTMDNLFEA